MQKKRDRVQDAMDLISGEDAKVLLLNLARKDPAIADTIVAYVREDASFVERGDIAESVYAELDALDVDDLYQHSGRTRDGYVDIGEEAWRMIEGAVHPAVEEMKKFQANSLHRAAREYCTGIMEGVARFRDQSGSEILGWAEDAPGQCIEEAADAFCKGEKDAPEREKMKERCNALIR